MHGRVSNLSTKFGLFRCLSTVFLGILIIITGCSGSSSSGSDSSGSLQGGTNRFEGGYSFVRFSSDHGGADTGARFTSGVGFGDFYEDGTLTHGVTGTANGQAVGAAFEIGSSTSSYDIDADGVLTVDGEFTGYVGVDRRIMISTDPIPGDAYEETGMTILVEEQTGRSVSDLVGRFSYVRFSSDHGGADTGAEFTSGVGYIDFDGAGGLTGACTGTANGQAVGESFLAGTFTATYDVADDGEVTIVDGSVGYVSPDGSILILTDPIPANDHEETGIVIGLKEATGLSNSSLNGRFSYVRFSSDHGGADTGAEFTSGIGYIVFDGAGSFTYACTGTANGQSGGEAFTTGTSSGAYTVASNGSVTFDGVIQGFLSADGNILIWTDRIPEDAYQETGIAVGVKTN
jgi:hypothetical protein